jgi:hypothetical protein
MTSDIKMAQQSFKENYPTILVHPVPKVWKQGRFFSLAKNTESAIHCDHVLVRYVTKLHTNPAVGAIRDQVTH